MRRAIPGVLAAVVVAAIAVVAFRPLRERARELAADLKLISADTGDVMAGATYQRFAKRREAVASMRAALLQVAAIESMFVADSGRPTVSLSGHYVPHDRSILGPSVEIHRDRWVAKVNHQNSTLSCTLTAMVDPTTFDSITWRYHTGQPVCVGWTAESTALANAPVPMSPTPEPTGLPAPPEPPPVPPKHHDWGRVNNTPPRMPYIRKETCEGEGCTITGTWAACSTVVARTDKKLDAASVFTISRGERFTALTADLHVLEPGILVFRRPFATTILLDEIGLVDLPFTPADTLFVLFDLGEGEVVWRYREGTMHGQMFWDPRRPLGSSDTVGLVRLARKVWWVRVRNGTGQEGWIVGDYYKMATGGYMDEIERCLPR